MGDVPTAEDQFRDMFDIVKDSTSHGATLFGDLSPRMNALREAGAVHKGFGADLLGCDDGDSYLPVREVYSFFSFDACDLAFRDTEHFSSEIYRELPMVNSMGDTILWKMGAEHRRLRAVAQPMFVQPKVVKWWRQNWIDPVVADLLEPLVGEARADLNYDLCARLPMQVITEAFGLTGDVAFNFRLNLMYAINALPASPEETARAIGEVNDTLYAAVQERRGSPKDDVISGLIQRALEVEGGGQRTLSNEEVAAYCRLVMFAGGTTTWRALGIAIWCLLIHEGCWEACARDRKLVPAAVEESLRWMPTDCFMPRLVTKEVEVAGVKLPLGARIDICMGAANRDPTRWDNPDVFDMYRPLKYNLATAIGPHQCLGHSVTRQEMICAINGLLDRFPDMQLDPDAPEPRIVGRAAHNRGVTALPVLLG